MNELFEKYLKSKAKVVDDEIEKLFPHDGTIQSWEYILGKATYTYDIDTLNKSITIPFYEFMDRGGKRWRPVLMMLAYEALTGKSGDDVKSLCPALEILHNGTICIDDIEDDSKLRRDKPCLHLIYGNDIAINVGNFMYFIAFMHLSKNPLNLDESKQLKLMKVFSEEGTQLHAGQAMDILWHKAGKEIISEKEYMQMCAYKTGVLPRLAFRVASVLADTNSVTEKKLASFGEAIGVAFQIQDDILNVTESKLSDMKGIGEDIHEGKRTLMVLRVLEVGSDSDKKRLLEILKKHSEDKKELLEAISFFEKYDAISYAKKVARDLVKSSMGDIKDVLNESQAKNTLIEFANYLIERDI